MKEHVPPDYPVFYPSDSARKENGGTPKPEAAGNPAPPGLFGSAHFLAHAAKVGIFAGGAEFVGLGALYYFTGIAGWWILVMLAFDTVGAVLFHSETWVRRIVRNHLFFWDPIHPQYEKAKLRLLSNITVKHKVARWMGFGMVVGCCIFKIASIRANEIPDMMLDGIILVYGLAVWVHLTTTGYFFAECHQRLLEWIDRSRFNAGISHRDTDTPPPCSAAQPVCLTFRSNARIKVDERCNGFGADGQHQILNLSDGEFEIQVAGLLTDDALAELIEGQRHDRQAMIDVASAGKWLQLSQMPGSGTPSLKLPPEHPPFLHQPQAVPSIEVVPGLTDKVATIQTHGKEATL